MNTHPCVLRGICSAVDATRGARGGGAAESAVCCVRVRITFQIVRAFMNCVGLLTKGLIQVP